MGIIGEIGRTIEPLAEKAINRTAKRIRPVVKRRLLKRYAVLQQHYDQVSIRKVKDGEKPVLTFLPTKTAAVMGARPYSATVNANPLTMFMMGTKKFRENAAHELEHVKLQFEDMARFFAGQEKDKDTEKGLDKFVQFLQKNARSATNGNVNYNPESSSLREKVMSRLCGFLESVDSSKTDINVFNRDFYRKAVQKKGVIDPGTSEAKRVQRYINEYSGTYVIPTMPSLPSFPPLPKRPGAFEAVDFNEMRGIYKEHGPIKGYFKNLKKVQKRQKETAAIYKQKLKEHQQELKRVAAERKKILRENKLNIKDNYTGSLMEKEAVAAGNAQKERDSLRFKTRQTLGKVADKLNLKKPDTPRRADNTT